NSDAVAKHFAEVASAVDIPIIVQDYPPISGYAMEASLLARIARDVPAARTIKLEDPPTPFKTARILDQAGGLEIAIFGGLGGAINQAADRIRKETGADVLPVPADLSKADAIAAWHKAAVEKFGGVDLLFCNTGGPPAGASLSFDDAQWQAAFDLLLLSAV